VASSPTIRGIRGTHQGTERAAALEAQARQVLELLADEVTLLQAMALTCQVALDCIGRGRGWEDGVKMLGIYFGDFTGILKRLFSGFMGCNRDF